MAETVLHPSHAAGLHGHDAQVAGALAAAGIGLWTAGLGRDTSIWWSPEARRLLGLPDAAPFDRAALLARLEPARRAALGRAVAGAIRSGQPYAGDHQVRRPDGAERWLRAHATVARGPDGRPQALVGLLQDITDARLAEEASRATRDRLRDFVQHMPVLLMAQDPEGRLVLWNEECARVTGYAADEIVGNPDALALLYPDPAQRQRLLRERLEKGEVYRDWEWSIRCKDGSQRSIAWSSIDDQDPDAGWPPCAVGLDVTERKRLEQQFLQSQKMEAVGRLAGGIAHDFNNLLTVIAGYTETVLNEISTTHPHRAALEQVRRAGDRAASLTRQLLLFTRRQLVEARALDLNHVVRDMERMLRRLIGEDLELGILPAREPCPVRIDPGQIEQVLMNLAVNSRDAMPDGGRLLIETAQIEISPTALSRRMTLQAGAYVILRVTDTGTGMSADTLAHIFEPFFTTKAPGRGTGLGLATVFGIVRQNGGHIEVSSALGLGTTFTIYLPRTLEPIAAAGPARPGRPQLRGDETILLVEDDDDVRALAREGLLLRGYKVLDVRDGSEAFLLSQGYQGLIHLLVSDVVMPVMSGPQVAELITLHRPAIKVLFISGYTGDMPFLEAPAPQPRTLLYKPFTMEMLARKVRDVLDA